MKGVTSEVITDVKARANLLEVVSEHVALKRAGKEYKGLCPFHQDKSPSFFVNPEKGIYKCFACGEGGDVFGFIQKIKNIDFVDTVRELAQRYGVPLVETQGDKSKADKRTLLLNLYEQACIYYARLLQEPEYGAVARDYLASRGITQEIIARFRLGYAANTWDGLLRYLADNHHVSTATLEEAGLVRRRTDGTSCFDLFRNRLMIPICDDQGRVIAFGGRTLDPNDQIKYLNSPESPIYIKGEHVFALNVAKEAIRTRDSVIVMEGYFDAISAHQFGFTQAVATLGTALTERQAKLLVRHTESKQVYLSFDADNAGQKAVDRGADTLNQIAEGIGIDLRVIRVPGGKDPDECLRSADFGAQAFEQAIAEAPALIDYRLEKSIELIDRTTHSGRIEAAKLVVPILAEIKNAVARGEYVRQWSHRLSLREEELLSDISQFRRNRGLVSVSYSARTNLQNQRASKMKPKSGFVEAENQLLACYLLSPESHSLAMRVLKNEKFTDANNQTIKEAIEIVSALTDDFDLLESKLMAQLAPRNEAARAAVDLILKAEQMREQNMPVEVILREGRARILKEKTNLEKDRLRLLLNLAKTEDEQAQLQSKIVELKQVETILLPQAQNDAQLSELRARIDEILKFGSPSDHLQLETT